MKSTVGIPISKVLGRTGKTNIGLILLWKWQLGLGHGQNQGPSNQGEYVNLVGILGKKSASYWVNRHNSFFKRKGQQIIAFEWTWSLVCLSLRYPFNSQRLQQNEEKWWINIQHSFLDNSTGSTGLTSQEILQIST